jgi:beta-lactamase regulating signal transducer with metallopeptidase domain
MNTLQTFLPQSLTDALGWTLLHSLWQGTLIAFTLGVAMILLRRSSARTRSVVASVALVSTMVAASLTFIALYEPIHVNEAALDAASAQIEKTMSTPTTAAAPDASIKVARALRFAPLRLSHIQITPEAAWIERVQEYLPILVVVWLLGAICLALRFLGGMAYAQRMRHFRAHPASSAWQNRVEEFSERLKLRRVPHLMESGLANAPMLVGFLKPVILVPMGFLTGLQTAHVEAIIAHEIAHARHQDYIMSIVQAIIETIMFYHPAVWWMSAQIRQEREHAADDLAVSLCGDSRALANALAILEERSLASDEAHFATAGVGANDGHLLTRVKRLLGKPTERTFSLEYLAAYCVITALFALSLTASPMLQPMVKPIIAPVVAQAQAAASTLVARMVAPIAPNANNLIAQNDSTKNDSERSFSFSSEDAISTEGFWEAKFKERALTLIMYKNKWGKNRYNGTVYTGLRYNEVQGLSADKARTLSGEVEFRLVKESGTFTFAGDAKGGEARGNYTFQPSKDYAEKLKSFGFTNVTDRDLVTLALTDVKIELLQELAGLKLSLDDAIEVAVVGIKPEFVREARKLGLNGEEIKEYGVLGIKTDYITEMKKNGYTIDEIKELGVLGIKPEYVNEMKKYGIKTEEIKEYGALGIRPEKVKELKDEGVPTDEIKEYGVLGIRPDYVKEMKALGYKVEDIKEIGVLGIRPEMVKEYKAAGVPVEEIKEYGVLGIKIDYVKQMKDLGYKVEDIKELGALGIRPAAVKEYKDAGVPISEIKEYGVLGIRMDYIKQMKALGYKVEDIKELGVLGIRPEMVKEFKDAGVPIREIKEYGVLGIRTGYIKEMKALGYKIEDIKEVGVLGIKPETVKAYKSAGLRVDDIKEFAVMGIKPEFVKKMRDKGFSSEEIREFGARGLTLDVISSLRGLGLNRDEISDFGVRDIKPEYIKEMKALGFSNDDIEELGVRRIKPEVAKELKAMGFSTDDIAEIGVRGFRISTIKKLKADGLSTKRIVEVLTDRD